ncbi:MAG: Asp-tRNA(Asn)/Glu-tRNA(Gln) amidotransferase subunit GatC [Proteobacteria bacterium]|nr:Asp-tRNA(Asn)/Glu-tRNA(Gln) amidotransferase subunit GatC [Pseudomonadota bacterium]MBU1742925.1 Asp-tRNA(Asn)/Glu-tRNA(Gln) amidotransferase subunit GatC [Pseudomonadota bacterium]
MPRITRAEVEHVARLARLELDEATVERMTGQLNDILSHMDKLGELDTTGVPPTTHAMELTNVWREDAVKESATVEEALENAPESDGRSFIVPKVV